MSVPAAPLELDGFGIGYTYIITYVFGHIRRIYLIYSPLIRRSIVVGVTGFKLMISMCSLIR